MSQVGESGLFPILEIGGRKISLVHSTAILLVGPTRAGKSGVFNWILHKALIGSGQFPTIYQPIDLTDESLAPMNDQFASNTLVPNIAQDYMEGVSLIDAAGYNDSRNFVGVLGVSYFLNEIFKRVRRVKFIIVLDELRLLEPSGKSVAETFDGFLNMFNIDQMQKVPQVMEQLKASVTMMITKAARSQLHYDYLGRMTQRLNSRALRFEKKDLIGQLIDYLKIQNRIGEFPQAVLNQNPEECTFVQHMNSLKNKWEYFDIDAAQKVLEKPVISVPFQKDFNLLNAEEQKNLANAIEERIDSYNNFTSVFKGVLSTFQENWKTLLETWKKGKFTPNYNQMKPLFGIVQEFLRKNDVYKSEETVNPEFRAVYESPDFLAVVNAIGNCYECVAQMDLESEGFKEAMQAFNGHFSRLIDNLYTFCTSNEEVKLIARLKYVMQRGFIEFSNIYDLAPYKVHQFKIRIQGTCVSLDCATEKTFSENIIYALNKNSDLMMKMFPTLERLQGYDDFCSKFVAKHESSLTDLFLIQNRLTIDTAKGGLHWAAGQQKEAIICYVQCVKTLMKMSVCEENSNREQTEKAKILNQLHMSRLVLMRKTGFSITKLSMREDAVSLLGFLGLALQLFQHYNMIDETYQIYEMMIAETKALAGKAQMYEDYSNYCKQWGRLQHALYLLQKRLSVVEDYDAYSYTLTLIRQLEADREKNRNEAKNKYDNWSRPASEDPKLQGILDDLEMLLQK